MSDFATRLSSFSPEIEDRVSLCSPIRKRNVCCRAHLVSLTSLKCALNGLLQGLLGLVQLPLDLHDAVSVVRVLELFDVPSKVALRLSILVCLQASLVRPRRLGELAGELVQDLAEQLVGNELVVVLVGDDDAGATLAAGIDVDGELILGL